jgi:hypothetical protein
MSVRFFHSLALKWKRSVKSVDVENTSQTTKFKDCEVFMEFPEGFDIINVKMGI